MADRAGLNLVFAKEGADVGRLRAMLHSLGFDLSETPLLTAHDAAAGEPARAHRAAAHVIFFDDMAAPWEALVSGLHQRGLATLGVITELPSPCSLDRCADFLVWPCRPPELAVRLDRLCRGQTWVDNGNHADNPAFRKNSDGLARLGLVGRSPAFLASVRLVERFGASEAPVLIEGETGTGKELVARALHYLSERSGGPFIPVNCGALPDSLFENELFGHERGAFTDARQAQRGLVAQADGGTLLLDEIDALTPRGQVALLRFLQDRRYRPLGTSRLRDSDVRVIAATNACLKERVAQGAFRQDLMFRLDVVKLRLPPLRHRSEDILILAHHFLAHFGRLYRLTPPLLPAAACAWLVRQSWPGNVRELENTIHRALLLCEDGRIETRHLLAADAAATEDELLAAEGEPFIGGLKAARARASQDFEQRYLRWLMTESGGNVTQAAKHASMERRTLGKLLKRHGIDRGAFFAPRGDKP